jgi:peptidoglycan/xylan/chitin deacetylase (PgdA/CDA1 family)
MTDVYSKIYTKLSQKAMHFKRDIRYLLGMDNGFYKNARGSRILIYHGICKEDHTRFNPIFLTEKTFEAHLKLYKKHCNVLSLDDYYNKRFSETQFNICITFDDGFANNNKYVLPLLEKYKLPATFFITAITHAGHDILWNDFLNIVTTYGPKKLVYNDGSYHKDEHRQYVDVNTGIRLKDKLRDTGFAEKAEMMETLYPLVPFKTQERHMEYWQQMTSEQIKELAASPYTHIGAHGYYHNDLAKINIGNAVKEMVSSKQYLESLTGKPVTSMAFPYGSYSQQVIYEAKKAGYEQLLVMDFYNSNDADDTTLRERFTVNPFISPVNQLYSTITRRYD